MEIEIKTIISNINKVINTLNTVEVKGRDNMNHLLGSIMVLEQTKPAVESLNAMAIELNDKIRDQEMLIDSLRPPQEAPHETAE